MNKGSKEARNNRHQNRTECRRREVSRRFLLMTIWKASLSTMENDEGMYSECGHKATRSEEAKSETHRSGPTDDDAEAN